MCGIVGVAGKIHQPEEKAFKYMLCMDTLRGPHSTGMVSVGAYNDHTTYDKHLGTPWDFFKNSTMIDNKGEIRGFNKTLIGHNRFATTGAINKDNAHPFHKGNIVGVHNGTLFKSAHERIDENKDFIVDSEAIYHNINKRGLIDTIGDIDGAWALVYYDTDDKMVNIIRNDQRPLYYAFSKNSKTIFWASEEWMILAACGRARVEISKTEQFSKDTHYQIDMSPKNWIGSKETVDLIKYEDKVEGREPPKVIYKKETNQNLVGFRGVVDNNVSKFPALRLKVRQEEREKCKDIISKVSTGKGTINVFFDGDTYSKFGSGWLYLRVVETHTLVKLFIKRNDKEIWDKVVNSFGDYFTCTVNGYNVEDNPDGLDTCQIHTAYNSLKGPFDWSKLPLKSIGDYTNYLLKNGDIDSDIEYDDNKVDEEVFEIIPGYTETLSEVTVRLEDTCSMCQAHETIDNFHNITFFKEGGYLCQECTDIGVNSYGVH